MAHLVLLECQGSRCLSTFNTLSSSLLSKLSVFLSGINPLLSARFSYLSICFLLQGHTGHKGDKGELGKDGEKVRLPRFGDEWSHLGDVRDIRDSSTLWETPPALDRGQSVEATKLNQTEDISSQWNHSLSPYGMLPLNVWGFYGICAWPAVGSTAPCIIIHHHLHLPRMTSSEYVYSPSHILWAGHLRRI